MPSGLSQPEKRNIFNLNKLLDWLFATPETSNPNPQPPRSPNWVPYEPPQHLWSPAEIARYLMLSPTTSHAIRPAEEFECDYPNGPRRVLALIDHLFVRYPVPKCLYRTMLSELGLRLIFPNEPHPAGRKKRMNREAKYRRWFHTIARGQPFADLVRKELTRKEAHWFLRSPARLPIEDAILWARATALEVPSEAIDLLLTRLGRQTLVGLDERLEGFFRMYARIWPDLGPEERLDIADFLRHVAFDPSFTFSGRTANSIRQLSDEWHARTHRYHTSHHQSWTPLLRPWTCRTIGSHVVAVELTKADDLWEEGARQQHCVGSYGSMCVQGRSRIVSLRWHLDLGDGETLELDRITVEIAASNRAIVQVRGKRNRAATHDEMLIVTQWASENGLRLHQVG